MSFLKATKQERRAKFKALKEKIKEHMHQKPHITVPELVAKTGESEYKVLQAYLPIRRELYARASR